MNKLVWILAASAAALTMGNAQRGPDLTGDVNKAAQLPRIAAPDLKGAGAAQVVMEVFNQTLWDDLAGSGVLAMAPKTLYPVGIPQQPSDFRQPTQAPVMTVGVTEQ